MFRERRNDLSERNQRKASPNSRRRILSPRANMARSRKPARRRILPLPAACILRTKVRRRRPEIPRASMARSPPINSDRIRSGPAPPTIYGRRKKRAEAKDRNLMRRRPGLTGPERNALPGRNRTRRRRHKAKRIRRDGNWNRPGKSWPHRSRQNGRDWQKKQSGVCGRKYGFTPTTRYTKSSMKTWVWKEPINPSLWRRPEPASSSVSVSYTHLTLPTIA